MLCRVADSLFWMARYMERAENTARLVEVYLQLEGQDDETARLYWKPILESTGDLKLFESFYDTLDHHTVADFLTFNPKNPGSIFSCISASRENARQIRDQISSDMWEVINRCYLSLKSASVQEVWNLDPFEFYQSIKDASHLFHGLTSATFPHREGLNFIECGKFLERADKTGRILDIKYHLLLPSPQDVGGGVDIAQWVALLRACSALVPYHQIYVSDIIPANVGEFLILSPDFPRSIHFCVDKLDENLHAISGCPRHFYSNEAERICGSLLSSLKFTRSQDIVNRGMHEFLDFVKQQLEIISLELNKSYMFFPIVDLAAELESPASQSQTAS